MWDHQIRRRLPPKRRWFLPALQRRGHAAPHRAIQGSARAGQGAKGESDTQGGSLNCSSHRKGKGRQGRPIWGLWGIVAGSGHVVQALGW